MRIRLKVNISSLLLLAGVLISSNAVAIAQYAGPAVTSPSREASAPASTMNAEYGSVRIMPGDLVSIATYGAPELTTSAGPGGGMKIGSKGEVTLPYLGTVKLAGLTPAEAVAFLSNALKEGGFLVDPQVTVQIVDSPTGAITVIGEVQRPMPVPSFGQPRLLNVISACGGFTPLASHTITVRRSGTAHPITVELGVDPKATDASDIPLMPGDTVIVPKVGNVFVVGEVKSAEALPLSGNAPLTVMRAITMAGGVKFSAALSKVRIIRTTADNRHIEIMLDLKKLMNGKEQDIALFSDDVLFIPANPFKASVAAGGASVAITALYAGTAIGSALK